MTYNVFGGTLNLTLSPLSPRLLAAAKGEGTGGEETRIENADFRYIFARSTSAVTPREKSSIITNSKSTTCFPMSPR